MRTQDTKLSAKRELAIRLLHAGLMTQGEAAELLGVTRQRVHQWVVAAGIHPVAARARALRELLREAAYS